MIHVTIGIPVYNVERFVEKSLLSALNQDFLLDYEILVIDDRSTDNSMEIVDHVKKTHPKGNIIRIIQHNKNEGLGAARNTIIDNACGEFLFFLDSDDTLTLDCISTLYNKIIERNDDVVIGSIDCVDEEGCLIETCHFADVSIVRPNAGAYLITQGYGWNYPVCNKLFRLQFLRENTICCKHSKFEDVLMGFRICLLSSSCICISQIVYHYTLNKNSITRSTPINEDLANTFVQIVNDMVGEVKKYHGIEFLYDFYLIYLRRIFMSINDRTFDTQIRIRINEQIRDYMKVVPSICCLKSRCHQMLWLISHFSSDYSLFVKIYKNIEDCRGNIKKLICR